MFSLPKPFIEILILLRSVVNIRTDHNATEEVTYRCDDEESLSSTAGAEKQSSDSKSYLKWNDEMLYFFVKECRLQKVHKIDDGLTVEQKWNLMLAAMKKSSLFISLESNKTSAIRKKLSDEKKRCKNQYGISDSCINLSGLSAKPNKTDQIILEMITDQNCKNLNAKRKRDEKQIKKRTLNGIVSDELANQGAGTSQFIANALNPASELSAFMTPPLQPAQRQRIDGQFSSSSLDSNGSSARSGQISTAEQFIEAQSRRIEEAIRGSSFQQANNDLRDPERSRLEAEMLQDEAATKRLHRQIAELQLAKLQREMGLN
jgi:hypothetical protein